MTITLVCGLKHEVHFAEAPATAEALIRHLRPCNAGSACMVDVTVEGCLIDDRMSEAEVERMNDTYQRIVLLAERVRYDELKKLITSVVEKGTENSDISWIYGKILFDKCGFDEALGHFIVALRWNAENFAALIMTGNLYARKSRDILLGAINNLHIAWKCCVLNS